MEPDFTLPIVLSIAFEPTTPKRIIGGDRCPRVTHERGNILASSRRIQTGRPRGTRVGLRSNRSETIDACVAYFNAPPNREATPAPPFDSTNLVSTGTNFPAISGDRPSFLNDPATEAMPPKPPREERPGTLLTGDEAGADLIRPAIPG